ncbi:hypothetical protein INT48_005683 [Thamnidium elegans]|uniref:Uncharacterized protein n=1 Tax=Thamnidium elegans TaxID=101142 RepID=A0A8H7SQP8_9FUNG|nr:hypothetical protein INT48_005683 [Thamnidium elegans]
MAATSILDRSFWNEKDEYIKTAIDAIAATNSPIRINKVSKQLTTCIVDSYDNITSIYAYKSEWCSRIGQILSNMNITFRLGIFHPRPQPLEASESSGNV